ncbi:MAG: hypothetical protein LUD12_11420 [Lachnospiraceae bacterium]|nr:hypothetical protein [Lachnospiraceae bacterium]
MEQIRNLAEYLLILEVDQIEDDQEFCNAEHEAIQEYCEQHGYELSEDDWSEIRSRGEERTFLNGKEWFETQSL